MKLEEYDDFVDSLCKQRYSFTVAKTNYSRVIKFGFGNTAIFNEDGVGHYDLLGLINKVKKDGRAYMTKYEFDETLPFDITRNSAFRQENSSFFKLVDLPLDDLNSGMVGLKIDIKSAYWEVAKKMGVVQDDTVEYFETKFLDNANPQINPKKARLVSLGSLATKKIFIEYENGIEKRSFPMPDQPTRQIYLDIQREVDILMKTMANEFESFYYYVDCLFVSREKFDKHKILDFIKQVGLDFSLEETSFSIHEIKSQEIPKLKGDENFPEDSFSDGYVSSNLYIKDIFTKKMYPIKTWDLVDLYKSGKINL